MLWYFWSYLEDLWINIWKNTLKNLYIKERVEVIISYYGALLWRNYYDGKIYQVCLFNELFTWEWRCLLKTSIKKIASSLCLWNVLLIQVSLDTLIKDLWSWECFVAVLLFISLDDIYSSMNLSQLIIRLTWLNISCS